MAELSEREEVLGALHRPCLAEELGEPVRELLQSTAAPTVCSVRVHSLHELLKRGGREGGREGIKESGRVGGSEGERSRERREIG